MSTLLLTPDKAHTPAANGYTPQTAPTQFVEADGVRFVYRRFGNKAVIPLVFIPDILGNMDSWDPSITDGFATDRGVILFDNAGVASSSGEVPTTLCGDGEKRRCLYRRSRTH